MNKPEQLEFKIASLRQDKIIYGVEACALTVLCLFIFVFSNQYFHGAFQTAINVLALVITVGYTLYMGIGNTLRYMGILKLEKELK